ncbi:MAG: DUF4445 domain-containing protein [Clostridia bacterium]|nr:MAG: DUF4445 domain-containing protein [Clostridia bacterium]
MELPPPSITAHATDLSRLEIDLRKRVQAGHFHIGLNNLRRLAEVVRAGDWKVTTTLAHMDGFTEIVNLEPGRSPGRAYGLAIDIGTTTVVVYLVDLATGARVDQRGGYNKQARYGDDVISRMIHATENGGLNELLAAVIATINELVEKLVQRNGIAKSDVCVAVSKPAVFPGIQSLLKTVQMDVNDIDRVLIAGGFGNYLNIRDAIQIGLLPDLPAPAGN